MATSSMADPRVPFMADQIMLPLRGLDGLAPRITLTTGLDPRVTVVLPTGLAPRITVGGDHVMLVTLVTRAGLLLRVRGR